MNRVARSLFLLSVLAVPLGGCGSMPDFDPTDWMAGDFFGTKKPLPGVRKQVFPEGVPGVARGVPTELVKGNQATTEDPSQDTALQIEEPKPKPKAKPKPRPQVAAKPAPAAPQSAPTSVTVRRAEPPQAQPQQSAQQPAAQWPDPPQTRQSPASGAQWPDPPPTR
jgi:hypothetical protein